MNNSVPSRPRSPGERLWSRGFDVGGRHPWFGMGMALLLVVLLVPVLNIWHGAAGPLGPSIPLFFLVPVLLASAVSGRRAGVLVSIVAIAVWDWYFISPLYTITIYYPRDVLALIVFLVVALLVGQLSTAARYRAEEALQRARSSEALYDLSLALIARSDLAGVLPTLTQRLRETFNLASCAVLLPDDRGGGWHTAAVAGQMPTALAVEGNRNVAAVAGWVNEHGQPSGLGQLGDEKRRGSQIVGFQMRRRRAQFLPLRVGGRAIGVLELVFKDNTPHDAGREHLLETFANGAAIALEQERLAREEQAAALARESDRLKSALLSSVSHDLRTPLAGIKAAASSLLQQDVQWSEEDRESFISDIDTEADRLTRLVSNLLDLSRIEAGAMRPDREWEDVGELIDRVTRRLEPRLAGRPIVRDVSETLPAVRLDAVQIEQVLTNLLENAAKYAEPGTPIIVGARVENGPGGAHDLYLSVADRGEGIPRAEQGRVFDKFYRLEGSRRRVGGTGMGLAIVKGLVEAHGGHVTVESTPGQGSTFTAILPIEQPGGDAGDASDATDHALAAPARNSDRDRDRDRAPR